MLEGALSIHTLLQELSEQSAAKTKLSETISQLERTGREQKEAGAGLEGEGGVEHIRSHSGPQLILRPSMRSFQSCSRIMKPRCLFTSSWRWR